MQRSSPFWDELAIQSYKAILAKKPDSALIHNNLGLAYVRVKKLNKAARSFLRAIKCDKNYLDAYYHLATTYQKMGKVDDAIKYFTKYNKLNAQDSQVVDDLLNKLQA